MKEGWKDSRHLVRMAALFLAGLGLFLVTRAWFVPKGFGAFGHYRAGALEDNRAKPIQFSGRKACEECHSDVADSRKGSKHEPVACEACHGAWARHAEDPGSVKPPRPDGRTLCLTCHRTNVAKPRAFPQVDPKDHGDEGPCIACHKPHHPEIA